MGTPAYSGGATAAGTFTDGIASGIGMESGIMLSSGSVADAVGPNQSDLTTTDFGLPGYAPLDIIAGGLTFDAALLGFSFTTTGEDLYFNYVFASEEYQEFVGSPFNDVFGFYVDGVNIGLVPGTSDPVTVNTINPSSNPAYYVNNWPPPAGVFDVEYDGFTTVLTATLTGLDPTVEHTMLFAIADTGDPWYDATVFIQAETFAPEPTPSVPEPATLILFGSGLIGLAVFRRRFRK